MQVTGKLNELEEQKAKNRKNEDRLAEVIRQFRQFRDDAYEKAQEGDKKLIELKNIAETLENENSIVSIFENIFSRLVFNKLKLI